MSNQKEDKFTGWGWVGAIMGGIYGYLLNENIGEAIGYAIAGYLTGWLVGFVIHTFLVWLVVTFILLIAISVLQTRLKWFSGSSSNFEIINCPKNLTEKEEKALDKFFVVNTSSQNPNTYCM